MAPDMEQALHRIAAMGGHEPVQEIVFPFQGQVEAAPGKGAGHGFDIGVRLIDGFARAALDSIGQHIEGGDDLLGHEAAKITDDFLTRPVKFRCTFTSLVIEILQCC